MYTPIRRSAYPDTRDEQAMRRFMAGTLNVGHHLTFQRKGNVVNVFPQADEKEKLVKIFDSLKIHVSNVICLKTCCQILTLSISYQSNVEKGSLCER